MQTVNKQNGRSEKWRETPTYPIRVPKKYKDILTLAAIALDRGLITEAELHDWINSKMD